MYLNKRNPSNFSLANFRSKYLGLLWVSARRVNSNTIYFESKLVTKSEKVNRIQALGPDRHGAVALHGETLHAHEYSMLAWFQAKHDFRSLAAIVTSSLLTEYPLS